MSTGQLSSDISEFQREYPMPDVRLLGARLWPLVKGPVYESLFSELGGVKVASFAEKAGRSDMLRHGLPRLLLSKVKLCRSILFGVSSDGGRPFGLILAHTLSRTLKDGKVVYPFADVFLEHGELKFSPFLIHNDKGQTPLPTLFPPDMPANALRQPGYLHPWQAPDVHHDVAQKINDFATALLAISVSPNHTKLRDQIVKVLYTNKVKRHLTGFVYEYRNSLCLLKKLKPEFVLLSVSQSHAGLILAARRLGIPSLEIQHGLITPDHRVYDWPISMINDPDSTIPDQLLVWGEYWQELMLRNGYWTKERLPIAGNPKFDLVAKGFVHNPRQEGTVLLFSSNAFVAKEGAAFILKTLELLGPNDSEGVSFWIKLHPNEKEATAYSELTHNFPDHVRIIAHAEMNFYDALKHAHIHISGFSISIYESVGLGVPTLVLDVLGSADVFKFDPQFPVPIARQPEELAARIKAWKMADQSLEAWKLGVKHEAERFFASAPNVRIRDLLNGLC